MTKERKEMLLEDIKDFEREIINEEGIIFSAQKTIKWAQDRIADIKEELGE